MQDHNLQVRLKAGISNFELAAGTRIELDSQLFQNNALLSYFSYYALLDRKEKNHYNLYIFVDFPYVRYYISLMNLDNKIMYVMVAAFVVFILSLIHI